LLGNSQDAIDPKGANCTFSTSTTDPPNLHPNELAQILSGDPRDIPLARDGLALEVSLPVNALLLIPALQLIFHKVPTREDIVDEL